MFFFSAGTSSSLPTREESSLGVIEYDSLKGTLEKKSKRVNTKFTEKERFLIGKYTTINGPGAAVRKFRKSHTHLKFGESQARALRKKYLDQEKKGPNVNEEIGTLKRGRPLTLEIVDERVFFKFSCSFLVVFFKLLGEKEALLIQWLSLQQQNLSLLKVTLNICKLWTLKIRRGQKAYYEGWVLREEKKQLQNLKYQDVPKMKLLLFCTIKLSILLRSIK